MQSIMIFMVFLIKKLHISYLQKSNILYYIYN